MSVIRFLFIAWVGFVFSNSLTAAEQTGGEETDPVAIPVLVGNCAHGVGEKSGPAKIYPDLSGVPNLPTLTFLDPLANTGVPAWVDAVGDLEINADTVYALHQLSYYAYFNHRVNGQTNPEAKHGWESPERRGVLTLAAVEATWNRSRSTRYALYQAQRAYEVSFDTNFEAVIRACAGMQRAAGTTWITETIIQAYLELHRRGIAHSIEVWKEGQLVGGSYGVQIGGVHSAESMFHTADNAGTLALYEHVLAAQASGLKWVDVQMVSKQPEKFGATYVTREQYLELVRAAHADPKPYVVPTSRLFTKTDK